MQDQTDKLNNQTNHPRALEAEADLLRAQLDSLKKLSHELEQEVSFLRRHIYEQQRIRNLVKNLVSAIDKTITMHLDKIARKPHYYPAIKLPETSKVSAEELLTVLQAADKQSFAGSPSLGWKLLTAFGTLLLFLYLEVRHALFWLAKKSVRGLLKLRAGARA